MNRLHTFVVIYLRVHRRFMSKTTTLILNKDLEIDAYKPAFIEKNKYDQWEESGLFTPETYSHKEKFSMVLPPPNVTGKLHLGHALACTIQDVIVRRKRLMGHNVLWVPGTDHAGIATQGVVEKYLQTKGTNRHDIGREKFIQEVWKWTENHGHTILDQLKTLGCSLDWSRQVFTMDPKHTHAVNTAFINLFRKGLIYRKKALVNWCHALQSTVSDIEVDNLPIDGSTEVLVAGYGRVKFGLMYDIAYKVYDSSEEVVVSTTMPETMLGDSAVAVHPDDKRYQHLKGRRVIHPFRKDTIPIIFDDFVDMQFGTGAVKITPAHSKVDYNIGKEHHLPLLQVIDEEGNMMNTEVFNKMKRYDCRIKLVDKLSEISLLKGVKSHQMTLPVCSRTGDIIVHLPKEQWFLSCSRLNEKATELVKNGQLKIVPEKFVKNWLDWTGDDRDWCISRQLWWGHQIPAYKCSLGKDIVWMAANNADAAKIEASKFLRSLPESIEAERDTDVLDTWFSSGIYPFAALGWPKFYENNDSSQFYPLSLMATGHDILGFWVHRMVILGLELTGQLPFHNIILHGVICDNKGAKMSKSKGNVIDPLDVINGISLQGLKEKGLEMHKNGILTKEELNKALAYHKSNYSSTNGIPECGVDALRFTMLSQDIKSHFVNFDVAMCHANKLFCNKILQSVKYTLIAFKKLNNFDGDITTNDLTYFDEWILSRLADMVEKVNTSMDAYDFHLSTKALRSFIYNEFCDVYLEATKPGFDGSDVKTAYAHAHTLSAVLNTSLRCLSPFMVYLTDELIPNVPSFEHNIIHNFNTELEKNIEFPQYTDFKLWRNDGIEKRVDKLLNSIKLIRELKGLYNISNKLRPCVYIKTGDEKLISDISDYENVFLNFVRCKQVKFGEVPDKNFIKCVYDKNTDIFLEIIGEDAHKVIQDGKVRLQKRAEKLRETIMKLESKFVSVPYWKHTAESVKELDNQKLVTRKQELEELERLIH